MTVSLAFLSYLKKVYYSPDNFFLKPVASAAGYCKHEGSKPIYTAPEVH